MNFLSIRPEDVEGSDLGGGHHIWNEGCNLFPRIILPELLELATRNTGRRNTLSPVFDIVYSSVTITFVCNLFLKTQRIR